MDCNFRNAPLGDVLVLGLGGSGAAVARYLLEQPEGRVSSVTVADSRAQGIEDAEAELVAAGARVLRAEQLPSHYQLAVASPGIAPHSPLYQAADAAADELIGEPEFAWRESPARWLAITGTNGKTTTTSLATELLRACGLRARSVGNIGTVATSVLAERAEDEWWVAELSSFQLHGARELRPVAAAILNVTPDHLAWHGSLEAYAADKERLFQNLSGDDLGIFNMDDAACAAMAARAAERGARVCELSCEREPAAEDAAFLRDGLLVVRSRGEEHILCGADELLIPGAHNLQNALAASALALAAGATPEGVREGLRAFEPLEHRIEPVGVVRGVTYVNDSKATDTDAVEKAVASFEPGRVLLLVGGKDKGTELEGFVARVLPYCAAVVCFGAARERLFAAFAQAADGMPVPGPHVVRARGLRSATQTATRLARPGDVVLLSPACASFDEFSGFEERGRAFKAQVAELSDAAKAEAAAPAEPAEGRA